MSRNLHKTKVPNFRNLIRLTLGKMGSTLVLILTGDILLYLRRIGDTYFLKGDTGPPRGKIRTGDRMQSNTLLDGVVDTHWRVFAEPYADGEVFGVGTSTGGVFGVGTSNGGEIGVGTSTEGVFGVGNTNKW